MSKLFLSIGHFPKPANLDSDSRVRSANPKKLQEILKVLKTWDSLIGIHEKDGGGDWEDFWEMAFRLHAGVYSGADEVYLSVNDGDGIKLEFSANADVSKSLNNQEIVSLENLKERINEFNLYGPLSRFSTLKLLENKQEILADNYCKLESFKKFARREIHVCGFGEPEEGEPPLKLEFREAIELLKQKGLTGAVVKPTRFKTMPLLRIENFEEETLKNTEHEIYDHRMSVAGLNDTLIVQERVSMTHEYRLFVVNGQLVSGAGCIERFTPLDNEGSDFDSRTEKHRGDGIVVASPQLVARYKEFGQLAANEFLLENLKTYVLDVAINQATDECLVIELNGLLNSGLYASNPDAVAKALVEIS